MLICLYVCMCFFACLYMLTYVYVCMFVLGYVSIFVCLFTCGQRFLYVPANPSKELSLLYNASYIDATQLK